MAYSILQIMKMQVINMQTMQISITYSKSETLQILISLILIWVTITNNGIREFNNRPTSRLVHGIIRSASHSQLREIFLKEILKLLNHKGLRLIHLQEFLR
jgi:hypothetical protein